MAVHDKDNIPMLSDTHPKSEDEIVDSRFRPFLSRTQSASTSIHLDSMESYGSETNLVGFTGPLRSARKAPLVQMSGPLYVTSNTGNLFLANHGVTAGIKVESKPEKHPSFNGMDQHDWDDKYTATNVHLMRSGQLGMCNDPYCTTCPLYYHSTASQQRHARAYSIFDSKNGIMNCFDAFMKEKGGASFGGSMYVVVVEVVQIKGLLVIFFMFHSVLYGDAKGVCSIPCFRDRMCSNHGFSIAERFHDKVHYFYVVLFLDLLDFLFSLQEEKCIVINWGMAKAIVFLRCLIDAIFLLNILLQFRLAYVAPESRVVGAGELVDHPKKIAKHYLRGFFFIDLFVVLPLPQITLLLLLLKGFNSIGAIYAKNLLQAVILVQYIPRLFRFIPLLIGPNGFIFETALANFFINLFTFVLSGHIIGLCWYLFGLQRLIHCLHHACYNSSYKNDCIKLMDCGGHENSVVRIGSNPSHNSWKENPNASACFTSDGFSYGIYTQAVNLTGENIIIRYTYSLVWGIQVIT
ncbi:hypothetical protein DKX38_022022 [Salix brachista]|uniref:Ion transport domain-containing protein n=1 Tax=Salix brachista TaxID=2182728 RepID=A0A5N5K391_9ROSI|nr:hypothetical protein DKX38_022022 [Salix brachista]